MEERVAALEAKVGDKTIEEQFREQAELIDRLFSYRFGEFDRKWEAKLNARFAEFDRQWDAKFDVFDSKLDAKLAPIHTDLAAVKDAVHVILTRLPKRR